MPNSTAESTEGPLNTSVQQDNGITTDNSHSYFLHQSDAPGMVLVNTPFDGKGYPEWRRSILISLSTKNKLGFIDEACPAPNLADPTFKLWSHCNDMVISGLLNFLFKDLSSSVLNYSRTAKDLWSDLEHRYDQPNGAKLYHLQKELVDLIQGSTDIVGYFTKMKRLWNDLDTLNANMFCSECSSEGRKENDSIERR
ncbi:uncharacterized protein [Solanum tuberosum]|uniref:uncharacterized protein n=1 Tax=Solanum tuberosum TaxID=4113 RepID=UPI00073A48A8|nr:PREDICTED: uncharacterized protein LOC107060118 [Solanum tuberosum]